MATISFDYNNEITAALNNGIFVTGFAARAGAFSALTAKGTAGMCCHIHVDLSLLSWASQGPKPCWQESVGERELCAVPCAAPHHSQPAVKWFLRDKREDTTGQCWVPAASAAALGLGTLCPFRGDLTATKPLVLRFTGSPALLHQLHKQSKLSESASRTPGSLLPSQPSILLTPGFFLEQSGLGKFSPFPFPHNICFQGDVASMEDLEQGHPALPKGCPQIASCTNRPLCKTKGIRGCLLTNF